MSKLSPKGLFALKHFGYMLVVALGGTVLAFLASPAVSDLISKQTALIAVPVLVALVSSIVQWAKTSEEEVPTDASKSVKLK